MSNVPREAIAELAPTGVLRAGIKPVQFSVGERQECGGRSRGRRSRHSAAPAPIAWGKRAPPSGVGLSAGLDALEVPINDVPSAGEQVFAVFGTDSSRLAMA